MLHTLRWLIGDKAWGDVTRLAVYGRVDPKPGNFTPRYGSTAEYQRFVRQVTGKDYGWFFDVYLRQAALPELKQSRTGTTADAGMGRAGGGRFPMPVDVRIGDRLQRVPMTGGRATLTVPAGAHVVVDPNARVLKRSIAIEDYRAWQAARQGARK